MRAMGKIRAVVALTPKKRQEAVMVPTSPVGTRAVSGTGKKKKSPEELSALIAGALQERQANDKSDESRTQRHVLSIQSKWRALLARSRERSASCSICHHRVPLLPANASDKAVGCSVHPTGHTGALVCSGSPVMPPSTSPPKSLMPP